jgi:hypothetical protein
MAVFLKPRRRQWTKQIAMCLAWREEIMAKLQP